MAVGVEPLRVGEVEVVAAVVLGEAVALASQVYVSVRVTPPSRPRESNQPSLHRTQYASDGVHAYLPGEPGAGHDQAGT
jgi:hypothetical protein